METHKLKTIEDICRLVTVENYENLMIDLNSFFAFHLKLKEKLSKEEYLSLNNFSVEWKDDGINGIKGIKINGEILEIKS
jgi:hypothetical protein